MARESQDARDARAARYNLGVQQEVTAEMRCAVRDAITALDAVCVGESLPQRDARVRTLLEYLAAADAYDEARVRDMEGDGDGLDDTEGEVLDAARTALDAALATAEKTP